MEGSRLTDAVSALLTPRLPFQEGDKVQINNIAWGERQLQVWTPDGKSEKANRRVDVRVDCKG